MGAARKHLHVVQPRMSFREVYEANFAFVWRLLVLQYGLPERNAEDAAQEVFVRFHASFEEWDQTRSVRSYLWGFARRVASEARRRASARRELLPGDDGLPDRADPVASAAAAQLDAQQLVSRALAELGEDHRDILVLAELEGHSIPEASEILGVELNTCYSRLARAKKEFERAVRRLTGSAS